MSDIQLPLNHPRPKLALMLAAFLILLFSMVTRAVIWGAIAGLMAGGLSYLEYGVISLDEVTRVGLEAGALGVLWTLYLVWEGWK